MKGAKDPSLSTEDITPEVKIALNREKMGQLGVNVAAVGMQLQGALSGNDDSQIDLGGSEYDIRVMLDAANRKDIQDISELSFTNNEGKQVRLSDFANISVDNAAGTLERKNRIPNTTLRCYVLGTAPGTVATAIEDYLKKAPLDPNVRLTWGGEIKRQKESFGALGTAMGIGVILVYLIMVALYDNFVYPFVVLFYFSVFGWCYPSVSPYIIQHGDFHDVRYVDAIGASCQKCHPDCRFHQSPQGKRNVHLFSLT
jgi:HAE1 family hydrophobic/amphiphilic exporter-1